MAALSWVGGAFPTALGLGATTVFGSIAAGYQDGQATETRASIHSAAGTYSLLSLNIFANNGTITGRFRKGAANGNQVISSGASGTGIFTDVTNSDAALTTDLVDVSFVSTGATTQYGSYGLQFSATGSVTAFYSNGASTSGVQTGGMFQPFGYTGGTWGGNATESTGQTKLRAAGTLSNLTTFQTNGLQTYKTRINGVTGNLSVTGAVGFAEDSTHSDAVASGDLVCMTCAATGGEITYQESVRFVASAASHDMIAGAAPTGAGIVSATFVPLHGPVVNALAESAAQMRCPAALKISNLRAYIVGAASAAATLRSRVGGVNGNQVVSLPATTQGWFEDVTNSDALTSGTLVCTEVTIASSSTAIVQIVTTLGPSLVTASGSVGTITLSAPAGGAVTSATATGSVGTITLSAPHGAASPGAQVTVPKFLAQAALAVPDSIESPKMLAQAATGIDDVVETPKQLAQAATGVTDATAGMVDGSIAAPKIVAYAALAPPPPRRPAQVRVQWSR